MTHSSSPWGVMGPNSLDLHLNVCFMPKCELLDSTLWMWSLLAPFFFYLLAFVCIFLGEEREFLQIIFSSRYLTIQFVRFFWKRESNQKAKILRVIPDFFS